MDIQQLFGGITTIARERAYLSPRSRPKGARPRPVASAPRGELDLAIGDLAATIDRRMARDADLGGQVTVRADGDDVETGPASFAMCTIVTAPGLVAGDFVLSLNTQVDLNALVVGSVRIYDDSIRFVQTDGTLIEIVSEPVVPTFQ